MRFRTRAFLLCFFPFALLFAASFWMAQKLVQSTVRNELLVALRERQLALRDAQAKTNLQNSQFLTIEGRSPELKSEMQVLLSDSPADDARKAIEDQLRAIGEQVGFDLLFVSAPDGAPLAGVVRPSSANVNRKNPLAPLDKVLAAQPSSGLLVLGDSMFQFTSAPIEGDGANIGTLSVGRYFRLPQLGEPTLLVHNAEVTDFNLNVSDTELAAVMKGCAGHQECDFLLGGADWIAIRMEDLGGDYALWSLENVNEVTNPIRNRLRSFFLFMEFGTLLIALFISAISSVSIERPIALVISQLHKAEETGVLPEMSLSLSSTREMRELMESYTRAAVSARIAGEKLRSAYVEFVGSLANALDARDSYTAGHSERVSQYAIATATALGLDKDQVEQIRIGARLHDIGKIGISDRVLQKPGRLTAKEFALVREHPVIGRKILEGVEGLAPYLDAVELHHENWDGSGYPKRQTAEETPIEARIIHVSDAYDAMTTHRSYRLRMTHEQATDELIRCAGTQFDPHIVEVFVKLPREVFSGLGAISEDQELETEQVQ